MSTHELCKYNQDILCDIERIGHRCIINILVFKGYPIDKMIENHIVFLIQQKYPELENCQLEIKQGKAFI